MMPADFLPLLPTIIPQFCEKRKSDDGNSSYSVKINNHSFQKMDKIYEKNITVDKN
ncbi:hypothetical protein BRYFOR_05274 [Marvinbryantia formatexigens DSM 14469]|uniref:Uncharacterized protein n=1 Tax=Marvinbryantia formatexigens DSM 14469 TaxID=478749 RepID=C6L9I4_9FIRM|nr:hypothetical protein BRYFOR_05274 [Marvinbryantia formatexigens DSM 14469]